MPVLCHKLSWRSYNIYASPWILTMTNDNLSLFLAWQHVKQIEASLWSSSLSFTPFVAPFCLYLLTTFSQLQSSITCAFASDRSFLALTRSCFSLLPRSSACCLCSSRPSVQDTHIHTQLLDEISGQGTLTISKIESLSVVARRALSSHRHGQA